jgi:hypothetical protein
MRKINFALFDLSTVIKGMEWIPFNSDRHCLFLSYHSMI